MALTAAPQPPDVAPREGGARLALFGDWTLAASARLEQKAQDLVALGSSVNFVTFDLSGVSRLDTAGAWLINRSRRTLAGESVIRMERLRGEPPCAGYVQAKKSPAVAGRALKGN